jgi:riboflavin synthase
MFTGLVQAIGTVAEAGRGPDGVLRLSVDAGGWAHRPSKGDSIAIDGCCLTLVDDPAGHNTLAFDAIPQTLAVTTLGDLKAGDRVNLEHAATPTTLLGGHMVQGHVDGTATVIGVQRGGDFRVTLRVPPGSEPFMVERGSVCLGGVSLTLAEVRAAGAEITVALIPTTLELTTLGELTPGRTVNLEADATTKAVVNTVLRVMESRK